MPSGFDTIKPKDSGDKNATSQPRLRGIKTLSDLRAMATESARLERLAHIEKPLSKSVKSTVEEYRHQGISSSTAPELRNMTEGQLLLEALSRPDWLNKLQERGIKVNKPTLELISQKLNEMRMKSPMPSDFNPAARNFNETLYKLEGILEDIGFTALRVEHVGLEGGGYYYRARNSRRYYSRIITLVDPKGKVHVFERGDWDDEIADFTQEQYKKGEALTESEVEKLRKGEILHGWTCTELKYFPLQKIVYCTDKGTEINALDLSAYKSYSREEHNDKYPSSTYINLEDPTPTYNCYGNTFIDGQAWLAESKTREDLVHRILNDNEYHLVGKKQAQIGDIVAYHEGGGSISHTATVIDVSLDEKNKRNIILESKMGDFGLVQHNMDDNMMIEYFGQPTIYHTDRYQADGKKGHRLYTKKEWQALQAQS